jgi:O-antigen ligase
MNVKKLHIITYIFLLTVFIFSTPFDVTHSKELSLQKRTFDEYDAAENIEMGALSRQISIFSLGLFALISLANIKRQRYHVDDSSAWLIIFFLVWALLSIIWAQDQFLALRRVVILYILSFAALVLAAKFSYRECATLALIICSFTLLVSLFTELYLGTFNPGSSEWRFGGILHPVAQGWNCGLLAMSSIALYRSSENRNKFYIFILIIALIFLFLTRSRMSFMTTILCITIFILLTSVLSFKKFIFISNALLCLLCVFYFLFGEIIFKYTFDLMNLERGIEARESLHTFTGRTEIWEVCINYFFEKPFIGYGYNAFFTPQMTIVISHEIGWVPGSPHSGYIELLLGLGIIGLINFLAILFLSIAKSIKLIKLDTYYAFTALILIWLSLNLITEALILTRPIFPNFFWMILISKLVFVK